MSEDKGIEFDDLISQMKTIEESLKRPATFPPNFLTFKSHFSGMPIYTSPNIPQYHKKQIEVPLTWRERLSSRPWRPWVKTKTIEVDDIEAPVIFRIGIRLYCNPIVNERLMTILTAQS